MSSAVPKELRSFWWENSVISFVDQRPLPAQLVVAQADCIDAVVAALQSGAVSGSQASDGFAALGLGLADRTCDSDDAWENAIGKLRGALSAAYRHPTFDRVAAMPRGTALDEARLALEENLAIDRAIAVNANPLLSHESAILAHGNTGTLGSAGTGTAVGAIIRAHQAGKRLRVFVCEGRPLAAGARIVDFELKSAGVSSTVIADAAMAWIMAGADVSAVLLGAAMVAPNGDVIGEIGTYGIALAAAQHRIPLYVCVPSDRITSGAEFAALAVAAPRTDAAGDWAPMVDRTPAHFLSGIVTEYGIARPPFHESLPDLSTRPRFALIHRDIIGNLSPGGRV